MADKTMHEIFIEKAHPRWDAIERTLESIFDSVYVPPTVSLSFNPSVSVKEFGESISSIILTATTTKKVKPITKVEFYQGSSLVDTKNSPNPDGGTESFTHGNLINETITFKAKVYDDKGSSENSKTISFVYPFYIGSLTNNVPNETEIKVLTKLVKTKSDTIQTFTLDNARFCIAYPKLYGILNSIQDQNNFETIGLYNITTVSVTGLNGIGVDYYVYTLSNATTQTSFKNTFKF